MPTLSEILTRNGVSNRIVSIEPHRDDHGLYRVKFSGSGDPSIMMDVGAALKLAAALESVHVDSVDQAAAREIAVRLTAAIEKARRYHKSRQF